MTPKEKALRITLNYYNISASWKLSKQYALIAVDEILESQPSYRYWDTYDDEEPSAVTFWKEVKNEIKLL